MITLQTKDLRAIQKRFQSIRQKNIIPILNNIKLISKDGKASLIKDNLDVFIIQSLNAEGDGELLLNETTFWNFIGFANTDTISIIIKGDNYTLQSGETKIKNRMESVIDFPNQKAIPDEDGIEIDINELYGLSSIILEEEIPTQRSFIFAGEGKASASDGFVGYSIDFTGVSKISLKKSVCNILPQQKFTFLSSDNYNFFFNNDVTFGFIKSEIAYFNIKNFFILPADASEGFEINRNELIKFNDLSLASSKGKTCAISFTVCDGLMGLNTHDDVTNNDIESVIEVNGEGEEFSYLADQMNKLLKVIPYETIRLIPAENKYYIQSPDGGIGLIMKAAI